MSEGKYAMLADDVDFKRWICLLPEILILKTFRIWHSYGNPKKNHLLSSVW